MKPRIIPLWLGSLFLMPVLLFAADFRITDIKAINGQVQLRYPSDPKCYYILQRGELEDITSPSALQLGRMGEGTVTDSAGGIPTGFFQLRQVDMATPLDTDADGIDDVYELEQGYDPLNGDDASQDADGDGRSNREEYENFDDPQFAGDHPLALPTIVFGPLQVAARKGMLDRAGRELFEIDPHVSLNDLGWIAFKAKIRDGGGTIRPNIFTVNPSNGQIIPMLNTAPDFELPQALGDEGPRQHFTAPMINNQNRVIAWRRMNAVVDVGLPQLVIAPMTYVEGWVAEGNETPGARGMPVQLFAVGNPGLHIFTAFLNPITGAFLPSPADLSSPWLGMPENPSGGFPAFNNLGQAVFTTIDHNVNFYLSTDANQNPSGALAAGATKRAKIADNGTIVTPLTDGGSTRIVLLSYANLQSQTVLASTSDGWSALGISPNISDDGQTVAFYGDVTQEKATALGITPGPGVFAALREGSSSWRIARVAGRSGNNQLDPGEEEFQEGFALRDRGPISGYVFDDRCGVGNAKTIAYLATLTNGLKAVCLTHISDPSPQMWVASIVAKQGDALPNSGSNTVSSLNLFDPIDNAIMPTVAFWAEGSGGGQFVLSATEIAKIESTDRLLSGTLNEKAIYRLSGNNSFSLGFTIEPRGLQAAALAGPPFEYPTFFADGSANVVVHQADNDASWNLPAFPTQQEIVVFRNPGPATFVFHSVFQVYGRIGIQIIDGDEPKFVFHELSPRPGFSYLIDKVGSIVVDAQGFPQPSPQGRSPAGPPEEPSPTYLTTRIVLPLVPGSPDRSLFAWAALGGFYDCSKETVAGFVTLAQSSPSELACALWEMSRWIGRQQNLTEAVVASVRNQMGQYTVSQEALGVDRALRLGGAANPRVQLAGDVFGRVACNLIPIKALAEGISLGASARTVIRQADLAVVVNPSVPIAHAGKTLISTFGKIEAISLADRIAWNGVELKLLAESVNNRPATEVIHATLRRMDASRMNFQVVARELQGYSRSKVFDAAFPALRRFAHIADYLGTELTEDGIIGFVRAYKRLLKPRGDLYDKLLLVFRGDKPRLARALADLSNPASRPDKELLTLLLVAKKEIEFADHPELIRFSGRFDQLKYDRVIEQGQEALALRIAEGYGGVRYEYRTGETLHRPPPHLTGGRPWDFENASNLKIELKGPVLRNGEFLAGQSYDIAFANDSLVRVVREELNKNSSVRLVDKIIVDTFGFGENERRFIETTIAGMANPNNIVIEIQ